MDDSRTTERGFTVKLKQDEGLERETTLQNTIPAHLGNFILSESKRFMNSSTRGFDGLKMIVVYYTNTDSLYMEKHWDVLDENKLVVYVKNLCQGGNGC